MPVPTEIIEKLKLYCEAHKLGVMQIESRTFTLLLLGDLELSVDMICIVAASALLQGVINGNWEEGNDIALKMKEEEKKH